MPNDLAVVKGELTSQDTDGWSTLINCASSHIYLKQMNRKCESALENGAEPVRVLSSVLGQNYPSDELEYSWKKLMQNHPHDSICCCSVDEVQDEMATRFNKSKQVADILQIRLIQRNTKSIKMHFRLLCLTRQAENAHQLCRWKLT